MYDSVEKKQNKTRSPTNNTNQKNTSLNAVLVYELMGNHKSVVIPVISEISNKQLLERRNSTRKTLGSSFYFSAIQVRKKF